ncbi:alpha/beta-hydrolase [Ceraceosorus guamensis]|uniref:Alpha/beta-hydrolase n=1 Tax=Ceraceosorus guamensis TaxID=1522189 RepID=A0A316VNE2_9BASI|nr:alpha/beta-hydrolase [Ceraceosorus guamensis]PWN39052.1 alpha/beta-hydrolase [Ceraceosorus guamensis]
MTDCATASTRPTWTDAQTRTVHSIRAAMAGFKSPVVPPLTLEELSRLPQDSVAPAGISITHAVAQPCKNLPLELVQDTNIQPKPVVYWTYRAEGDPAVPAKALFYVHGGGNTTNSPVSTTYIPRFHQLLESAGKKKTVVVAPAYRLATAPENAFPASLQDVFAAYMALLHDQGYEAQNISLIGDSSGGNLVLGLLKLLGDAGGALPSKVALLAPAGDLTHIFSAEAASAADVDLFAYESYEEMAGNYLYEASSSMAKACGQAPSSYRIFPRDHPLVSAAHVGAQGWAKTAATGFSGVRIWVGDADQLADASHKIANDLKQAGARDVQIKVLQDMPHGFWILDVFPQCGQTWREVGAYVVA